MSQSRVNSSRSYEKWWILISILLIIAIIAGGVVLGLKQWDRGKPIEIILASTPASTLTLLWVGKTIYNYEIEKDSQLCREN